jgi:type III pantothenate kinase
MFLCLDNGNSNLCGGIFKGDKLILQFRYDTKKIGTADELGIFIRSVLKENNIDYNKIDKIGIASVVPYTDSIIKTSCIRYLNRTPIFLESSIKTGIQITTNHPHKVGADLIAGVMAGRFIVPNTNLLVFDFGTATTCCYLNHQGDLLGYSIAPGFRIMMESLHNHTAQLLEVEIVQPKTAIAKNTKTAIQSGIYYSQLGLIEQLISQTITENNLAVKPILIATGGYSSLFTHTQIFNKIIPELVLLGIKLMLEHN